MLMVGQSDFVRARALRHGLFLGSWYWRAIGSFILLQEARKKLLGREPEPIAVERLRSGHRVKITVSEPNLQLGRRERRRTLARMRAEAEAGAGVKPTS